MCPARQHPDLGLFDQGRVAGEQAEFAIDAAAGLLLRANRAGCGLWGLQPAALPFALDRAMPALQRLREIACRNCGHPAHAQMLTFWTARGGMHLLCRVEASGVADAAVTVRVVDVASAGDAAAPPHRRNGRMANGSDGHPGVAFDAWLAHELRTPLSAVIAYAEILKDEHFGPLANARYKAYARDVYHSARLALSVVDNMLQGDPTRSLVPPLAFADLEPVRVVESCLTVARPLAERAHLAIGGQYAPHLPRIFADELSLKQMLLNLLTNAIKFARPGDRVTVAVTCEGAERLAISVTDTGPGMVRDAGQPACADALSHGPARHPAAGLGLGLPLTRALAAANGAVFDIASEPGKGTRATISFGPDRIVAA
jgi:anti-sigma regulatory factor (Ser/Thr protein kinase)